jgi:phosphatidylinositol glycan class M
VIEALFESDFVFTIAFYSKLVLVYSISTRYAKDLLVALFLHTYTFVAFNKVCTAQASGKMPRFYHRFSLCNGSSLQYFVWYMPFIPLIMPFSTLKFRWKGCLITLTWLLSEVNVVMTAASPGFDHLKLQLHWLFWGYNLEFLGRNVFLQLWFAGVIFFLSNILVVVSIVLHHKDSNLQGIQIDDRKDQEL